jgi:chitinase domain-containing protein 1
MEDLHALFNDEAEITALKEMLIKNCEKYKFDGYVFEIYIQLGGKGKSNIAHIVIDIAEALHESNRKFILVIPPSLKKENDAQPPEIFNKDDFDLLKDKVDGFSLMTYDYAQHNSMIGPNAPLNWIEQNINYLTEEPRYLEKILLGKKIDFIKFKI